MQGCPAELSGIEWSALCGVQCRTVPCSRAQFNAREWSGMKLSRMQDSGVSGAVD